MEIQRGILVGGIEAGQHALRHNSLLNPHKMTSNSDIEEAVLETIEIAVRAIESLPEGYEPSNEIAPIGRRFSEKFLTSGVTVDRLLQNKAVSEYVGRQINELPSDLFNAFVNGGRILSHLLRGFGVTPEFEMPSPEADPELWELVHYYAQHQEQTEQSNDGDGSDIMGFKAALGLEIERRVLMNRVPYAQTLTALLGDDALHWLTAETRDDLGKVQPHEFTRTGWPRLFEIKSQSIIEQELQIQISGAEHIPKALVIAAWVVAIMARFVPAGVFLGESCTNILSRRDGNFTVSQGTESRILFEFKRDGALPTLNILREVLLNSEFSGADAMWIALSLSPVSGIEIRHKETIRPNRDDFDVFVSHRGMDSKLQLAQSLQKRPSIDGIFLDCLKLPKGNINRYFIYNSLCNSREIVIVDSPNYSSSIWCRKEEWLTQQMHNHGLINVKRTDLSGALEIVDGLGVGDSRRSRDLKYDYEISGRVAHDIDYWARSPNLHSLRELESHPRLVAMFEAFLNSDLDSTEPSQVAEIWSQLNSILEASFEYDPEHDVFEIWATLAQVLLMHFSRDMSSMSKDHVRRIVDQMNALLKEFLSSGLTKHPAFEENQRGYLIAIIAAVLIDATGHQLLPERAGIFDGLLGKSMFIRDSVVICDARVAGEVREFNLQFALLFMQHNIGGVGILQNAWDEVHGTLVQEVPLEVLPCITVHKGMEPWFLARDGTFPPPEE